MKAPRTDRLQCGFTKYFHPDFYGTWNIMFWGTCALKVAAARFGVYCKWGFRKIRGTLGFPYFRKAPNAALWTAVALRCSGIQGLSLGLNECSLFTYRLVLLIT